jgi:hypothetical protein
VLAGLVLAFAELVEVLPVVDDPADGRICAGRYLDEVQTAFTSELQTFVRRHDAKLFAFLIDHSDLSGADPLVHPNISVSDRHFLPLPKIETRKSKLAGADRVSSS